MLAIGIKNPSAALCAVYLPRSVDFRPAYPLILLASCHLRLRRSTARLVAKLDGAPAETTLRPRQAGPLDAVLAQVMPVCADIIRTQHLVLAEIDVGEVEKGVAPVLASRGCIVGTRGADRIGETPKNRRRPSTAIIAVKRVLARRTPKKPVEPRIRTIFVAGLGSRSTAPQMIGWESGSEPFHLRCRHHA
jgi:hypothetical protein